MEGYNFFIKVYEDGSQYPSMEFFEDRYKFLENLATDYLSISSTVNLEIEKIREVLSGKQKEHSFADSDWCIVNVIGNITKISNGFDEFPTIELSSSDFLILLEKWLGFLQKYEKGEIPNLECFNKANNESKSTFSTKKSYFEKGISYFDNILKTFKMKLNFDEDYKYGAAKIYSDECIINISLDRYYPDLNIYFINPKTNQEYSYGMVMNLRQIFEKEKSLEKKIDDENRKIENDLKDIAYLIEKYCTDILSGDFSNLEKST